MEGYSESILALSKSDKKFNRWILWLTVLVVFFNALLVLPNLARILPHPDEHQFYLNAWAIMGGRQLQNFLHVASTEYALAIFLSAANLLAKTGVNFPQGDPTYATWFFGRIFGYLLYLVTFVLAALVLQKGASRLRPRILFLAILYFGSLGIFERFLRVNSDSFSVFVVINYLILSLYFHRKRFSTFRFFLLNLFFVFLLSFTNLKALYLGLPLFFLNTLIPFFSFEMDSKGAYEGLPKIYRLIFFILGILTGSVILWYALIPKPVDPHVFWYNIKNATVRGTGFDFEYPSQSGKSGLFYAYDFLVEYVGFSQLLAVLALGFLALRLRGWSFMKSLGRRLKDQTNRQRLSEGRLFESTELIVLSILLSYYLGVATTQIHWSRWGAPLGVLGLMLLAVLLEKAWQVLQEFWNSTAPAGSILGLLKTRPWLFFSFLFLFSWSLFFLLISDIARSDYPTAGDFAQTKTALNLFLKKKGIAAEEAKKKVAWFTGYTGNVGNLSLEKLVDPEFRGVKFLIWPYWNIGSLYSPHVDKFTTNQEAFLEKYARSVHFGFPTLTSYYMHASKMFAWKYLGLTWNPEIDSLVEAQYGLVELKDLPPVLSLDFEVADKDLSHYYATESRVFNLKTLPDSYTFPPCYSHPHVKDFKTGVEVSPPPDIGVGARTAGLYCHSLWFRVLFRGKYQVKFEGLPKDQEDKFKVYSSQPSDWDPVNRVLTHSRPDTFISAEFGIATPQKNLPKLKVLVSYDLEPK